MEKAILPTGQAHEPNEGARNPVVESMSPHPHEDHLSSSRKLITFAEGVSEKSTSQKSYKDVLSQPQEGLNHLEKLLWLQKRRSTGLWVQCDECDRWRYLPHVLDSTELPYKWYCRMNPDSSFADCSVPETPILPHEEEDLIHSVYSAGSLVWARLAGWPWWPAMVDDCPDTEQYYWLDGFSDIPTHYNVTFFDTNPVTRSWITPSNLKPFLLNKNIAQFTLKQKKYRSRLQLATKQAENASKLPLAKRLEECSFLARYTGTVNEPKPIAKTDLIRQQKKMQRRFNIDFATEIERDNKRPSDGETDFKIKDSAGKPTKTANKKKNSAETDIPVLPAKRDKPTVPKFAKKNENAKKRAQDTDVGMVPPRTSPRKKPSPNATKPEQDSVAVQTTVPKFAKKKEDAKKHAQDTDVGIVPPRTSPRKKPSANAIKPEQDSMAVQIGSTSDTAPATVTESYDDDTSKTYVPESERTLNSTQSPAARGTFELRASSPSSSDFEF